MLEDPGYRLWVDADPLADGLLRVLGVVAVQPVRLVCVRHRLEDGCATTILEFGAASAERVALLVARIRQLVWVREVGLTSLGASEAAICDGIAQPDQQTIAY